MRNKIIFCIFFTSGLVATNTVPVNYSSSITFFDDNSKKTFYTSFDRKIPREAVQRFFNGENNSKKTPYTSSDMASITFNGENNSKKTPYTSSDIEVPYEITQLFKQLSAENRNKIQMVSGLLDKRLLPNLETKLKSFYDRKKIIYNEDQIKSTLEEFRKIYFMIHILLIDTLEGILLLKNYNMIMNNIQENLQILKKNIPEEIAQLAQELIKQPMTYKKDEIMRGIDQIMAEILIELFFLDELSDEQELFFEYLNLLEFDKYIYGIQWLLLKYNLKAVWPDLKLFLKKTILSPFYGSKTMVEIPNEITNLRRSVSYYTATFRKIQRVPEELKIRVKDYFSGEDNHYTDDEIDSMTKEYYTTCIIFEIIFSSILGDLLICVSSNKKNYIDKKKIIDQRKMRIKYKISLLKKYIPNENPIIGLIQNDAIKLFEKWLDKKDQKNPKTSATNEKDTTDAKTSATNEKDTKDAQDSAANKENQDTLGR